MSFSEMKESLLTLSASERAELHECLQAMQEGVSVEEFRAIKAELDEELNDPSPELTLEEVQASIEALGRTDVPAA